MRRGIYIGCQLAFAVMLTTVLCLGSILSPSLANATVYYVAANGGGSTCSQASPCGKIATGISKLSAGDTLYIRQGTYTEQISVFNQIIPHGTSWKNPVTIASYPGENATLQYPGYDTTIIALQDNVDASVPAYLIFDRLTVDCNSFGNPQTGIYMGGTTHHIRFQNGVVKNCGAGQSGHGSGGGGLNIQISSTTHFHEVINSDIYGGYYYAFYINGADMLLEGNRIHDNGGFGVHLYREGGGTVNNNIIRNNIFYNNGNHDPRGQQSFGLIIASGSNNVAYNNVFYSNQSGIQVAYTNGGANNQIYNNTIYGNSISGIDVFNDAPGTVIKNNIIFKNGDGSSSQQIIDRGATGTVQSNNLITNPQFVNVSANDFSLQAASPAINAGLTVSQVTTDIKGIARPQGTAYDIGAYEVSKGSTPLTVPSNFRLVTVSP
jgi:parallel beta-helix repeat protein